MFPILRFTRERLERGWCTWKENRSFFVRSLNKSNINWIRNKEIESKPRTSSEMSPPKLNFFHSSAVFKKNETEMAITVFPNRNVLFKVLRRRRLPTRKIAIANIKVAEINPRCQKNEQVLSKN